MLLNEDFGFIFCSFSLRFSSLLHLVLENWNERIGHVLPLNASLITLVMLKNALYLLICITVIHLILTVLVLVNLVSTLKQHV